MLNRLNLEKIRRHEHGVTSRLILLGESDSKFVILHVLETHFAITRQRDAEVGGYVDRLSVKLPFADDRRAWNRTAAVLLETKHEPDGLRYRLDAKSDTRQSDVLYGFATATMMANEKTPIVFEAI